MTADLLHTVVAAARRAAEERARRLPVPAVEAQTGGGGGGRFIAALSAPGVSIIAECKRRSPSRGILRREYNPEELARGYAGAGAAAISVLTEPTFFDGALDHLTSVRRVVGLPLLRKDFIVTEYQIAEARGAGADAVLLIVAALAPDRLVALLGCAATEGLAALVEVHDARELDRALEAGAAVVGVNSRNLRTLEVDQSIFEQLADRIPDGVIAVAESGLRTAEEIRQLADRRYDAFLIGERLMIEPDPGRTLAGLIEAIGSGAA